MTTGITGRFPAVGFDESNIPPGRIAVQWVNTEIRAKIVFWLKFLITLDDSNKEPAYVSRRDYAAV